jgi:rhodanese-related sulfurtransferase
MAEPARSLLLEHPPAADAADHFRAALACATDPADVFAERERGGADFVIVDARSPEAYARGHVPGAVSLPHRTIAARTTSAFRKDRLIVTYCDGIGCNASTKGALKLAELGLKVKELIGGIEWWKRDGYPTESALVEIAQ